MGKQGDELAERRFSVDVSGLGDSLGEAYNPQIEQQLANALEQLRITVADEVGEGTTRKSVMHFSTISLHRSRNHGARIETHWQY